MIDCNIYNCKYNHKGSCIAKNISIRVWEDENGQEVIACKTFQYKKEDDLADGDTSSSNRKER